MEGSTVPACAALTAFMHLYQHVDRMLCFSVQCWRSTVSSSFQE